MALLRFIGSASCTYNLVRNENGWRHDPLGATRRERTYHKGIPSIDGYEFRCEEWASAEPGLSLEVTFGSLSYIQVPLALVSLHALARRLQRGCDVSQEAVLAELRGLGRATGKLGAELCVPTADGRWIGTMAVVDDGGRRPVMACVLTFKRR